MRIACDSGALRAGGCVRHSAGACHPLGSASRSGEQVRHGLYTAQVRRAPVVVLMAVVAASAQQPGARPYGDSVQRDLAQAWEQRPAGYRPRTRHVREDGSPLYTNRLFLESSPYLLQHAHNPVDWRPWSDEAFEVARRLGRPVLLSVGYSTCHWCHVMEEESFEDEEIARFINENYVAIKVDREQRPDVDAVYLAAVQAMTGRGGWPMTLWLTPDREPYFAGTYFPPRDGDRGVKNGFLTLLKRMREVYEEQQDAVSHNASVAAERVVSMLSEDSTGESAPVLGEAVEAAIETYRQRFDSENGGLRGAPKFPNGLPLRLLLDQYSVKSDETLKRMAATTLAAIMAGGIHDHVNGGVHRYAVDERWRVPHFEKMLYDNALLVAALIEARRAIGDPEFEKQAIDTLRFMAEELAAPEGGFYSAIDADSVNPATGEREEGLFYTWTPAELTEALDDEDAAFAARAWGVTDDGDVEGRSVIRHAKADVDQQRLARLRRKLRSAREASPKPFRDEKVVAAWNGLAIAAFAEAGFALDEPSYAEAARRAARFLLDRMRVDGRLQRSFFHGKLSGEGYLDDYANVISGLISLFETTGEMEWLQEAIALEEVLELRFAHPQGGYYLTADDQETVIVRQRPGHDGASPSGNSVQALNLLRLYELTTDERYSERAERLMRSFSSSMRVEPTAMAEMLRAAVWSRTTPKQVLFVAPTLEEARRLASEIRWAHAPHRVLAVAAETDIPRFSETVKLLEGKRAIGGRPTAYVCEERVCRLPTSDPEEIRRLLR